METINLDNCSEKYGYVEQILAWGLNLFYWTSLRPEK